MKRLAPLLFLALASAPLAALELQPRSTTLLCDGLPQTVTYFPDGTKRVYLTPPQGWKLESVGANAGLFNEELRSTTVYFALSPKPLLPSDEAGKTVVRDSLLSRVPKGCTAVVEAEEADPLTINGWRSYRAAISYERGDATIHQSVLLIRLNNLEELQVLISGADDDFAAASSAAMACLLTWHKE